MLMTPTRGTTPKAGCLAAIFSKRSTPRSHRSDVILKLTSSSIPRCGGPSSGDSRTPCFSRWARQRSSFTPYSIARGTRKVGNADETHNKRLEKLAAEVMREESEKTPMARKVHASFTKFQALVGPWDHVAEGAYHQLVSV